MNILNIKIKVGNYDNLKRLDHARSEIERLYVKEKRKSDGRKENEKVREYNKNHHSFVQHYIV